MPKTNVIYIVSSGHSGSTLLDLLLGCHPRVTSLGEIAHFDQYMAENGRCTCQQQTHDCSLWQAVRLEIQGRHGVDVFAASHHFPTALTGKAATPMRRFVSHQRAILAAIGSRALTRLELTPPGLASGRCIAENAFALFDAVCAASGSDFVVDSSKSRTRMMWLSMARPEQLKALYLVRDGRGTMASYMRKGRTPEEAVRNWVKKQTMAELTLRRMPHDARLFVRYEDLCSDPTGELRRICRFLSLDFAERMLRFRDVVHHNIGGNHMRFSGSNEIVNSETWRHKLSPANLRLFERVGGDVNRKLGYAPTDPSLLSS